MKIHEYQAKELFQAYGIPVPSGEVAETPEAVEAIAQKLGGKVVVKAQIHAGGRGKGGGVKLASTPEEAKAIAEKMLGKPLVTHQTGPEGRIVRKVLVEEALNIKKEFYVGLTLDRSSKTLVLMASQEGGVEIEALAQSRPEAILKVPVHPLLGILPFQLRRICYFLGLEGSSAKEAQKLLTNLCRLYMEKDASLGEINPLILTQEGRVIALDAKLNFDDSALFRHEDVLALRDIYEEDPLEVEASKYKLNYIKLSGTVGCMVNGAGLAMATMDAIKLYGAEPANFLDVGGGANQEAVSNAFRILLKDKSVKAVLINIFGGIVRCDVIARGVVSATQEVPLLVPLVVRLEGTNVEEGRRILKESGIAMTLASHMAEAAQKVVALAGGA